MRASIGILGGSGLYGMEGLEVVEERVVDTPFGAPSDAIVLGRLDGVDVAFLSRHGRGHRLAPHEIGYRANIWALKSVGVRWLISVSAVGSMREDIAPGQLVLVDQFIDRTRMRPSTFFEDGVVAHVGLADPCCRVLRETLAEAAAAASLPVHPNGTYVCIEGPQFSTKAESRTYRQWGVDVIGMTNLPEARLAREAQIAYATIAMATDYDCWHEGHDAVTVEAVVAVMKSNVAKAQSLLRAVVGRLEGRGPSPTWSALEHAVMTAPDAITAEARERLTLFLNDTEFHGPGPQES